jgi:MFS family permease
VLFVLCSGVGLVMATLTSLYTAGPDLARSIGASQTDLTWIVDAYTVAVAGLLLPAGALGDRYGRREVMIGGLILFVAAAIVLQFVTTPPMVIADRVVLGVAAALILPATLSLITSTFPEDFRDAAVGIWTASFTLAGGLGVVSTGLLLEFFSWRSSFWSVLVGGIFVLLCSFTVPTSRDEHPPPLDSLGAVVAAIAITALVFGLIDAGLKGWSDPLIVGAVALGVGMCAMFAVVQLRAAEPLLDVRLFAIRPFGVSAFTVTACFAAVYGSFFMAMEYEQFVLGFSALKAALPVAAMGFTVIPISLVAARLTARVGLRVVTSLGCALSALSFLVFLSFDAGTSYPLVYTSFLVIGIGTGLNMAPCTAAIINNVSAEKQGVAAAVNHTTRELGTALGVALLGGVLSAGYRTRIAPALARLPAPTRGPSQESLPGALAVASSIGHRGALLVASSHLAPDRRGLHLLQQHRHALALHRRGLRLEHTAADLVHAAQASFVGGIHETCLVMAGVMGAAAVISLVWAPPRRRPVQVPTVERPPAFHQAPLAPIADWTATTTAATATRTQLRRRLGPLTIAASLALFAILVRAGVRARSG